jgi:hypothetical protein
MYKVNKGFIFQKMGNSIAIFDPELSTMHTISGIGPFIFQKIKKGISRSNICTILEKKYQKNKKTVEEDVNRFIQELVKLKIIEVVRESK